MAIPELTKCLVTGSILDPSGNPVSGGSITFSLSNWDKDGEVSIMPIPLSIPIDSDGYFEVELWPNAAGLVETHYKSIIRNIEGRTLASITLVVPEEATVNYTDITHPVPPPAVDDTGED